MENREKNYWGYRIDVKNQDFFFKELQQGRLRQGWGYAENQKLPETKDSGARKNLSMYHNVKKGDMLLIPRLPDWGSVAIVEATDDWDDKEKGYKFEIDDEKKDYGHIFPAKYIGCFNRHGKDVSGNIQSTLKARNRFWNISRFSEDIEKIMGNLEGNRESTSVIENIKNIVSEQVKSHFDLKGFSEKVIDEYNRKFTASQWEEVIKNILEKIYPGYEIERIGGSKEEKHGTDILVTISGLSNLEKYNIAMQVKNYNDVISDNNIDNIIKQINKAEEYVWENNGKLIDKILVITSAKKEENPKLIKKCKKENIKVIFSEELKKLILRSIIESIDLKEIFDEMLQE
ncbi:hypothetical protein AB8B22_06335 [Leptotrichia sp. HSP-334]|uniref:Restriction endonuclease type IV Mrr domain-containing protein n=1 Tax=Leptotrichia rugosa TaxID=3239302 RepID=A0AB39VFG6_9FUSO